jgi:hypothetical protein
VFLTLLTDSVFLCFWVWLAQKFAKVDEIWTGFRHFVTLSRAVSRTLSRLSHHQTNKPKCKSKVRSRLTLQWGQRNTCEASEQTSNSKRASGKCFTSHHDSLSRHITSQHTVQHSARCSQPQLRAHTSVLSPHTTNQLPSCHSCLPCL